eukprot:2868171-Amphidinium_carterae.1
MVCLRLSSFSSASLHGLKTSTLDMIGRNQMAASGRKGSSSSRPEMSMPLFLGMPRIVEIQTVEWRSCQDPKN